ncbi:ABC transporter ATP-binding protein [Nocardioides immobilis]|uniref:ABC transporter ATP-binding protein n=1 Tax=Nocardioides immobilis TaxID=2049295 RepID=UPI001C713A95|nr:ABC transporter ATP-binding protein [Nocardioides immobilis]
MNAQLRAEQVTVSFGAVKALDDVSISVSPGGIHAVIGPNGAGKSTLFNVLSGVYPVTSGTVVFADLDVTKSRPHKLVRAGLARTYQNIVLGHVTVEEAILLGRHHLTRAGFLRCALRTPGARAEAKAARQSVHHLAEMLGLADSLHRIATELPYGDQKRVELARALAAEPEVLLLDEPVAGMNGHEKDEMTELLATIHARGDTTMVLVEHDMRMVLSLATHCTVLDFGRVIADGSPAYVASHPEVLRAYLGSAHAPREVTP